MILTYYTRQVYGKTVMYPADDKAMAFLKALGTKTFTNQALAILAELGIEMNRVLEPL